MRNDSLGLTILGLAVVLIGSFTVVFLQSPWGDPVQMASAEAMAQLNVQQAQDQFLVSQAQAEIFRTEQARREDATTQQQIQLLGEAVDHQTEMYQREREAFTQWERVKQEVFYVAGTILSVAIGVLLTLVGWFGGRAYYLTIQHRVQGISHSNDKRFVWNTPNEHTGSSPPPIYNSSDVYSTPPRRKPPGTTTRPMKDGPAL